MTFPLADPAFNNANIAALYIAEHTGNDEYLALAVSASGLEHPPALCFDALTGAATHVETAPPSPADGSPAAPRLEPGRRSLHEESERIRALIEAKREASL